MISENYCIFIVFNHKELQIKIAMLTRTKLQNYSVWQMISTSFLIRWQQNIRRKVKTSALTIVIQPCQRQKSCLSWYCFTIPVIGVLNTFILRRYENICADFSQRSSHIIVLLNWKEMLLSLLPCLSKRFC